MTEKPLRPPRGLRPNARVATSTLRMPLRAIAALRLIRVKVVNRKAVLNRTAGFQVAGNHQSYLDPIIVWGALRQPSPAVAMKQLWAVPVVNVVMWVLGHIPAIGQSALNMMIRVLENNGCIIIFPEGGCSRNGKVKKLKSGCCRAAFATNTPVVAVGLKGCEELWPFGKLPRFWKRTQAEVIFGKEFHPDNYRQRYDSEEAAMRTMEDDLRQEISMLSGRPLDD